MNWPFILLVIIDVCIFFLPGRIYGLIEHGRGSERSLVLLLVVGFLCIPISRLLFTDKASDGDSEGKRRTRLYGLDHGRLHLKVPSAMWMNMGYWKQESKEDDGEQKRDMSILQSKTMAGACRDLLSEVLKTAGFDRTQDSANDQSDTRGKKCLIDLGFGCGEQTIYLTSATPIRQSDTEWWDSRPHCPYIDFYIGITLDQKQFQYAKERVQECRVRCGEEAFMRSNVKLFCGDAARPEVWSQDLKQSVEEAVNDTQEHWTLALDTAYHFSPSRWPVITYGCHKLNASYMAFDLCISPNASITQKLVLWILTTLTRAPWANFVTPEDYRRKLIEAGYKDSQIMMKDVSEHVFEPLTAFLERQDRNLRLVGYSLGSFNVAKRMFGWWARSGVIRGFIVVAKISQGK